MRLATLSTPDGPRACALLGDKYVDLNATDSSLPSCVQGLLEAGPDALARADEVSKRGDAVSFPAAEAKLLAPLPNPPKIICIGLNYHDHAAESGVPVPKTPVIFSKFSTAIIGPEEPIVLPAVSNEVDYEAELVLVIGKKGRPKSESEAKDYIVGYTVGHDVSARDWQLRRDGKQWLSGKTFDTFAPIGPHLVTKDEVPNAMALPIRLRLNSETMQDSNTKELIFSPENIVSYLAQIMTLQPGDIIFTGTPPGVGFARDPKVFLKAGDVTEVEIEPLGVLRNPVTQGN